MITIDKFEFVDPEENEHSSIRLDFTYHGDRDFEATIFAKDKLFNTLSMFTRLRFSPSVSYWCIFEGKEMLPSNTLYKTGVNLVIYDEDTQIFEKTLNPPIPRSFKRPDGKSPVMWVIGDSHVGNILKDIEPEHLKSGDYRIRPISHYELSLNRFLNSDTDAFMESISIEPGDRIAICLGDIDMRASVIAKTSSKGMTHVQIMEGVIDRYISFLLDLRDKYPDCTISVLLPTPPIRDGFIQDPYLVSGTQRERSELYQMFEERISRSSGEKEFDIQRPYELYRDSDGYVDARYLSNGDHHIKDPIHYLECLSQICKDQTIRYHFSKS